ncbi:hypothetical protein JOB18_047877 [Solea senegalensis]|uniref:Uncharacterized protein n=1 Tax=Solea senegalensis TaxID=28829 RepID=A0AAV6Q626_SOLSE|nr:hypothetical protein JOB18_047877 [Solea senegalensis]
MRDVVGGHLHVIMRRRKKHFDCDAAVLHCEPQSRFAGHRLHPTKQVYTIMPSLKSLPVFPVLVRGLPGRSLVIYRGHKCATATTAATASGFSSRRLEAHPEHTNTLSPIDVRGATNPAGGDLGEKNKSGGEVEMTVNGGDERELSSL